MSAAALHNSFAVIFPDEFVDFPVFLVRIFEIRLLKMVWKLKLAKCKKSKDKVKSMIGF